MNSNIFKWAVIGAGPAGIAAIGELLDFGENANDILWCDPYFQVGDFGRYWKYVTSNTSVQLFLDFLNGYRAFNYAKRPRTFKIDQLDKAGFCELRAVSEPLQWITSELRQRVYAEIDQVNQLSIDNGSWLLETESQKYHHVEKVILATGSDVKSLPAHDHVDTIALETALNPTKLAKVCNSEDTVAVYGSSHSSMIIIRELIKNGVKEIVNFFLKPITFALTCDDWTLYDNTGLKAETAKWVHENISQRCLPNIKRYYSSPENIRKHITRCNKAVYTIGFKPRSLTVKDINTTEYDINTGIIAAGLFGAGIAYPQTMTTPLGHKELNVGIWKFMNDIRKVMPIWKRYEL